jgi:hypothetical protein
MVPGDLLYGGVHCSHHNKSHSLAILFPHSVPALWGLFLGGSWGNFEENVERFNSEEKMEELREKFCLKKIRTFWKKNAKNGKNFPFPNFLNHTNFLWS